MASKSWLNKQTNRDIEEMFRCQKIEWVKERDMVHNWKLRTFLSFCSITDRPKDQVVYISDVYYQGKPFKKNCLLS